MNQVSSFHDCYNVFVLISSYFSFKHSSGDRHKEHTHR